MTCLHLNCVSTSFRAPYVWFTTKVKQILLGAPCRCVVGPRGRLSCSRDPLESSSYRSPGLKTEREVQRSLPIWQKIHGIYDIYMISIWYLYDIYMISIWYLYDIYMIVYGVLMDVQDVYDCYNHKHLEPHESSEFVHGMLMDLVGIEATSSNNSTSSKVKIRCDGIGANGGAYLMTWISPANWINTCNINYIWRFLTDFFMGF